MTLEEAKQALKILIRSDDADGINGVGIDPFRGKLVVFYTNMNKARAILQNQFGDDFLDSVDLVPGTPASPSESVRKGLLIAFRKILLAVKEKFPLKPASPIRPIGGIEGHVGCFVKHQDGAVGVVTAEHIFSNREEHLVQAKVGIPHFFKDIGKSWKFGNIKARPTVNTADCASFLPDDTQVELQKDMRINGRIIDSQGIVKIEKKKVGNLVPGTSEGKVLDATALIVYKVFLDGKLEEAIFDNQVLVEGAGFAISGDSGALVVMEQPVPQAGILKGDAVGLLTFVNAERDRHIVTPFFECVGPLKVSNIHQPP